VDVRRAYCSAVDRTVPVVLKPGAAPRDRVTLQDPSDLVCLDYKVRCTGWCCPLFSVSDDTPVAAAAAGPGAPAESMKTAEAKRRWNRPT
jgi:hypothetical protein